MIRLVSMLLSGIAILVLGASAMVAGLPDDALTSSGIVLRDNVNWIWNK